ncbi:ATP-dependent helicase [Butyrivibrio sp. JL13D10]|uniref:ATP-dependent helicase n=1 Tax=Butyrivibrio sp. JL13D10 TaxID=3236815 RepID=UPI0038B4F4C1
MKPDIDLRCNSAQRSAIEHFEGPACIIAGPGSGKTFVIIKRILNLIRRGVDPGSILTITFTKAAAIEMQQRFIKETDSVYPEVLFGTFHSIFYHILDNRNYSILKEADKYKILRHILYGKDYDNESIRLILSEISRLKNTGDSPLDCDKSVPFYENFPAIYEEYNKILKEQSLIDFDDMVLLCRDYLISRPDIRKKWQNKLSFIQIDEFQDINKMQFEVVKLLLDENHNLFVVGDDDQSIYGFRGSDPKLMLSFDEYYENTRKIILDTNYRCALPILEASKLVISENKVRFIKDIKSGKKHSDGIVSGNAFLDRNEEYSHILKAINTMKTKMPLNEIAIIVRTNTEATCIARVLNENKVPCFYKEKIIALHEKPVIMDVLSYMAFAKDGNKRSDFLRIMNKPVRYICRQCCENQIIVEKELIDYYTKLGKLNMAATVQKLFRDMKLLSKLSPKGAVRFIRGYLGYDKYLKEKNSGNKKVLDTQMDELDEFETLCSDFNYYEDLIEYLDDTSKVLDSMRTSKVLNKQGIRVMTMHASKGLEFKAVFLPDLNEGIVPSRKSITNEEIEEERRMLYVAMTRAKEELYLLYVKGTKENPMRKSGFLRPLNDLF